MNEQERWLISFVCDGDIRKAQKQAKLILEKLETKKDEAFKQQMLRKLAEKGPTLIELPYNLRDLLVAEDVSMFPESRFLMRDGEIGAARKVLAAYRAADKLADMGISYHPTLMLHGESGCGKTMLARYIAHLADLPFVYVRFSSLVSSHLGGTQTNISRVFDYAKSSPCVLCFDEIDAIGMARGQQDDVGEMNRIVIALMQELDRLPNNVMVVGTTNRFDRLDSALVRRFSLSYEVKRLTGAEVIQLADKFFKDTETVPEQGVAGWCKENFVENGAPASAVIEKCTDVVIQNVIREAEAGTADYGFQPAINSWEQKQDKEE